MKKKYRTGIQKQASNLFEYGCVIEKLPYVTRTSVIKELKKPKETEKQTNDRVNQAIYHLVLKGVIRQARKSEVAEGENTVGKYVFIKTNNKYYPKCKHLITKNKRPYCPIKKHYIGNPDDQCIAVDDVDSMRKISMPKCKGYTDKDNPEMSRHKLNNDIAMWIGNYRFYNGSQYDPESKYYLPNLKALESDVGCVCTTIFSSEQ